MAKRIKSNPIWPRIDGFKYKFPCIICGKTIVTKHGGKRMCTRCYKRWSDNQIRLEQERIEQQTKGDYH